MKAFNPASGLIVTLISLTILGGLALSPQSIIAGPWVELTTPPGLQRWICYAGNTYLFVAGDEGLYRTPLSSPGIWESIGLAGMDLYCMVAGGEDDSFIMAGSRGADLMNRTTDGGESWITTSGSSEIRTVMLAWNGELPGRVYSYHWESSSYGSQHLVCVNTDFGAQWDCTWSHWNPAGEPYPCWVDYLAAPSDGSNNAYLGVTCNGCLGEQEMGSRKSTDGGATWFNLPGYLVQMIDQVSATTSSIDPQRLFVAIYDQIHKWQGDQYFGVESCGISTSSVISPRWAGGDLFVGGDIDTG
ncbi:MAG: hypothetical protein KJ927_18535, partial [Candidatus Eisenbacteria bacterium]|nr:hypothetical protein [Candidatus Eisenbacteria bacterium]